MGDPVNSFDRSGLTCEVLLPDGTTFTATECVNVDADYPDDGWNNSFWNYFFLGSSPSPPRRQREHPAMPAADSSDASHPFRVKPATGILGRRWDPGWKTIDRLIGLAKDEGGPTDVAEKHDEYLYGGLRPR